MKPFNSIDQKKIAFVLIGLGAFLILFILVFIYFKIIRISGFPEFLPVNDTIAYGEFHIKLNGMEEVKKQINNTFKINWDTDILPWAQEKGALIFLKSKTEGQLLPFVALQINSIGKAFSFLKNYQNPTGIAKENHIDGVTAFSTPAVHFVFFSDVLVISPSKSGLEAFLSYQSTFSKHLSSNSEFITIRKNLSMQENSFFIYTQPKSAFTAISPFLSRYVPQMPFTIMPFPAIGIAASKSEKGWEGNSYALLENPITLEKKEEGYDAKLLLLLPSDFDTILAGQNMTSQINKLKKLIAKDSSTPLITDIESTLIKEYLQGINFENDVLPLFQKEFAFERNESKILFLTELGTSSQEINIQKISDSFIKTAYTGKFTPKTREVELPDGKTKAQELVPDPSKVATYIEEFNGVKISGIKLDKNGIFNAVTGDIWFISNDLATLKKSLLLRSEAGLNFRDSAEYRLSLQPILKDPEFIGTAVFPQGIFSFSKHTFFDHMETNFSFMVD